MENIYEKFTNLYSVSKTLRFELIPQGKTLERMKENHIIENDEKKSKSYTKAKKMIDNYHKKFINECLDNYNLDKELLEQYFEILNDKSKGKDDLKEIQSKLRKEISNLFIKNVEYKTLFSKEIITQVLPNFYSEKEDLSVLDEFNHFYTYFTGFNENRKNIYVADEKSTAISYRIINENFPIFATNMKMFEYAKEVLDEKVKETLEEELNVILKVNTIEEMFKIDYFNEVLTQSGIDIYNSIIGGYSKEDGTKIKGINEYINEYKQLNPNDKKISKLNILYKQVLSDSKTASFVIEKVESDQDLLNIINELSVNINESIFNVDHNLEKLLVNIKEYDLSKIYVRNDLSITNISQYLFDDWSVISQAIKDDYDINFGIPKNEKQEENKRKYLKSRANLTIEYLNNCIQKNEKNLRIEQYFTDGCVKENEIKNIFENAKFNYEKIKDLLKNEYPKDKNMKKDDENIAIIKEYLDSIKTIQLFIKPLVAVRFDVDKVKDNKFYDQLFDFWDKICEINNVYNKARNYLTGKPYSTDKIKLNFDSPTLLDGWDINKEQSNRSIILRKNGLYYLAIFDKRFKGNINKNELGTKDDYEKMDYKLLPGANKMLPKVFFSDKNSELFKPSHELISRYKNGEHKKGEKFDINFCHQLIDYFKQCINIHPDWKNFNFKFSDTSTYEDMSGFYREVEEQGYKINFSYVDSQYIDELVEDGSIYLFKIYNKDFSTYTHGRPNLHTLYWKAIFSEENLKNIVYKLNGEAEIFYRKASIEKKITHPKNQKVKNKNKNNPKQTSLFNYDLIKDKRYAEDKIQFHVPISMNFKAIGISNINEQVNLAIKNNKENYIIGIDRGERNLLYLSVINSKGKIIKQDTLNSISNEIGYETNYHDLLDEREKKREEERESWKTIENIKELKEGYLSQVINKITDLMIKYNAIVVLEDLNFGFMRGRQKFEKQVYQKFEKMLIDKLNYLVKKDIDENNIGGVLHAYQLTNKFESFKKLGKQSGFLFYIPAWNTSKMDPVTGFVNLFYIKYENEKKAKEFFEKIDNVKYNSSNSYFEFDIDYNKFNNKAEGTKTKWTLCTYGNRIKTFRNKESNNQWDNVEVNITDEFIKLFEEHNIDIRSENLKEKILNVEGKFFWENFINLFKLMLQMRNSITGTEVDYIISPISDKNGNFFDSRKLDEKYPKDADANGAYNIARKGLWIVKQIKNTPDNELKKIKLAVSNKEWLEFIQNEEYGI